MHGEAARCYNVVKTGETLDVCLSSAGIPVSLSAGGTELTLTGLDENFPRRDITAPARVSS